MFERFLRMPVNVDTEVGTLAGVLAAVGEIRPGGWRSLLIYSFRGEWILVRTWVSVKTARSST